MARGALLALTTCLLSQSAFAEKLVFDRSRTSVVTNSKSCVIRDPGEPEAGYRCWGPRGYFIEVDFAADTTIYSVRHRSAALNEGQPRFLVQYGVGEPKKMEWLRVNGAPFAVVFDHVEFDLDDEGRSTGGPRTRKLEVRGLGAFEAISFEVDALATPYPYRVARKQATAAFRSALRHAPP